MKNKVNPIQHLHLHQHQHQLCLQTGTLHHLCRIYVGIIEEQKQQLEEQKQQIRQLQEELAEFNRVQYRTLPANASRRKNVLRSSKKVSMTPTDHINQQAIAPYVRKAFGQETRCFQRVGVSAGMIKEVCVR
jgi:hypothetical protein